MHEKYENWIKLADQMSRASRLEPETAEENIMASVMGAIEEILSSLPSANRIWTLHKIAGQQVRFHRSNFRPRARDPKKVAMPISSGLIGKALVEDRNVKFYYDAPKQPGFELGWNDCQSEVIAIVRNTQGKAIGVINIESNHVSDFITKQDSLNYKEYNCDGKKSFEEYLDAQRGSLEKVLIIASNHLSRIFQNQALTQLNQSGTKLIETVCKDSIVSVNKLSSIIEESIYFWLKDVFDIQKAIFYVFEDDISDNDNFTYYNLAQYVDYFIDRRSFPETISILPEQIDDSFITPVECSVKRVTIIMGEPFKNDFINNEDILYIHAPCSHDKLHYKYISIMSFNSSSRISLNDITRYSNIIDYIFKRFSINKARKYDSLINETITGIYKISLEGGDVRTSLDKVASQIAEKTGGIFCLIYMIAEEYHHHSQYNFYLSGAGKGYVNFADRRFEQEVGIIGQVLKEKKPFYSSDFYKSEINKHLLDKSLQDHGLEQPELYAYPLMRKNRGLQESGPNGVVLLFRENKEKRFDSNRPNNKTVEGMLLEYSEYLSRIIHVRVNEQVDSILLSSLKELMKINNEIYNGSSDIKNISNFIDSLQERVLPQWAGIVSPVYLAVYKRNNNSFEIVDVNSKLKRKTELSTPPKFGLGKGLTGSVVLREDSELYEPFIEDYENYKKDDIEYLEPDETCKIFWNDAIGDKRRMFYGKHIRIGIDNYVLLLIGQRKQEFMPSIGYKLAAEFTNAIESTFIDMIKVATDFESEERNYLEELKIFKSLALSEGGMLSDIDKAKLSEFFEAYIENPKEKENNISSHGEIYKKIKDGLHEISNVSKDFSGIYQFIQKLLLGF